MAQSWAKEQQGRAEHGAGRKKAFVLRLTGPEIEDGKASLAAYRAQHFVNQHDAGRARSELRIISRKYKTQAVPRGRAIAVGNRSAAVEQKIASHRPPLCIVAELRQEKLAVGQSEPQQAVLIGLRR